jgi:hypothetical protein
MQWRSEVSRHTLLMSSAHACTNVSSIEYRYKHVNAYYATFIVHGELIYHMYMISVLKLHKESLFS